ncbi:MAG: response regulator [Candidatus Margulisiibacteriota bacterium]|nr:MAG: hypothetical protein A2X43_13635 [Candidatus Margulisbacteria bacterium GWD2_39_127]PZM79746.1 MAG: response regulator [Candidatus Margulisiibacteriota bacterium]HAR62141.1 response regulator [Candidatus Margulisiibacteriota bacterium]HCT85136.1 response regulator [Candidatus Margulisiibacteriota bacterium]HCY36698.1 response regulator [Candidatus Margulisiibacteriota bacterium]
MKILIVEDDFTSRKMMRLLLTPYGETDISTNGKEAIDVFSTALEQGDKYDLICLDIMLPEIDGHNVLKQIRAFEKIHGIEGLDGVKVIFTTALADAQNVRKAFFDNQCEAYLVKPINKKKLLTQIAKLGFKI